MNEKPQPVASKPLTFFRHMPGYPWLDPCPRCGFRGSCDCTVLERARAANPGLFIPNDYGKEGKPQ